MVQRKLLLLALVLLLLPVGTVASRSSTSSVVQRFVVVGGGAADSANYTITSVIGQPATTVVDSANYKVSGGFLHPLRQGSGVGRELWLPVIIK